MLSVPIFARAAGGWVQCDTNCTLGQLGDTLTRIYVFLVNDIATPLGTLMVIIGGAIMLTSAGDPGRMGLGKKILWAAIIGLVLVFCSKMIIKTILQAVGSKIPI